jgi:hypothetical protein
MKRALIAFACLLCVACETPMPRVPMTPTGWLLMIPPPKYDGQFTPNFDAPLSEWSQDSGHDTARDCEEAKVSTYSGFKNKGDTHMASYYVQARCVPAEYVYSPKLAR